MASFVYKTWVRRRRTRIDQLIELRLATAERGPESTKLVQQLDAAVVLCLMAEFQGFARELHEVAGRYYAQVVARGNPRLAERLSKWSRACRKLDRGNASPAVLAADYQHLGFDLWKAVEADHPGSGLRRDLDVLIRVRNAIAHADERALRRLESEGCVVELDTVRTWINSLDGLARTMDDGLSKSLAEELGRGRPW